MGHPQLDLTSKTAVVIGGTSGIGLAITKGLALAGANVVPAGRRGELAKSVATEIERAGGKALGHPVEVTNRESLQALLSATTTKFGSVEILVNSAGTTKRTPSLQVPDDEWDNIMEPT